MYLFLFLSFDGMLFIIIKNQSTLMKHHNIISKSCFLTTFSSFFLFVDIKIMTFFQRFKYGSNEGLWCFFETCHIVGRWWGCVSYIPEKVNKNTWSMINGTGSQNKEIVFFISPLFFALLEPKLRFDAAKRMSGLPL